MFRKKELIKQSFLQRILNQLPEENAVIEINNLLASVPVEKITHSEIQSISKKYKLILYEVFPKNIKEFYAYYLENSIVNNNLSDQKKKDLEHFQELLDIPDNTIKEIHNKVLSVIYKKEYERVAKTGKITKEDDDYFEKIGNNFSLEKSITEEISNNVREQQMNKMIQKIIEDGRISPEEEKELNDLAKGLNINLTYTDTDIELFKRMKYYWELENNKLTPIITDINLQKEEACYYSTSVNWYELRSETQRYNYAGPTARIKIMKGVYYRAGSISAKPIKKDVLRQIDSGIIYLTNKRIIFMGEKKNTNIRLNRILSFIPYSDGIQIEKDAGKSPFLSIDKDITSFSIVLSRLINEY
ncbi:MAG: hypothetical protein M9887_12115 [Chitinophagales bacterium]|nr:hypothetical protein [Chitinophagales bacterium]